MRTLTKVLVVLACVALLLSLAPVALAQDVTVRTLYSVRLREGPGTDFAVLATIPFNVVVPAVGRNEDSSWIQVKYEGQTGWIAARFVSVRGSLDSLPIGGAQEAPAGDVSLTVVNNLDRSLTIVLTGPARYTLFVPAGESKTFQILAGTYTYTVTVRGSRALTGEGMFQSGDVYEWPFTIREP